MLLLLLLISAALPLVAGLTLIFASYQEIHFSVCGKCGYDLRGSIESLRCPECGTIFDRDHVLQPRHAISRHWMIVMGILLAVAGEIVLMLLIYSFLGHLLA